MFKVLVGYILNAKAVFKPSTSSMHSSAVAMAGQGFQSVLLQTLSSLIRHFCC